MTFKPLAAAVLCIAVAASSGAAAQTAVPIAPGAYAPIGAGPMRVTNLSSGAVEICAALTTPPPSTQCPAIQGGGVADFTTPLNLYAQATGPAVNLAFSAIAADVNGSPFQGAVAMTVGTTYAAQRSLGVVCTVAGNVTFQLADGSTLTLPAAVGWQTFPFAVTQIVAAGTTATATYFNLK